MYKAKLNEAKKWIYYLTICLHKPPTCITCIIISVHIFNPFIMILYWMYQWNVNNVHKVIMHVHAPRLIACPNYNNVIEKVR